MSKYDRFAKRFLPIKGFVSEAAGRGGFACSGVPKNCYMINVTNFSLFNSNFTIFRRYYKMQFVRLKLLTNNKNMYRNRMWFNLKIKDAWKTPIVPDILTKCPWKLLYTVAVWTPEYVLNCIRRIPCGRKIFHHHLRVFNSRVYSVFLVYFLSSSPGSNGIEIPAHNVDIISLPLILPYASVAS